MWYCNTVNNIYIFKYDICDMVREGKTIRISNKAYDLLAKNHKYPESLADTLDRILGNKLDK